MADLKRVERYTIRDERGSKTRRARLVLDDRQGGERTVTVDAGALLDSLEDVGYLIEGERA